MRKNLSSLIIVIICFMFFTEEGLSQYGQLDLGFGQGGIVRTVIGLNGYEEVWGLALQDSGKIVAAGYIGNGSDWDFALARYKYDGSLDSAFGTNGTVVTPVGSSDDIIYSIAVQDDGKIIAAGYSNNGTDNDFVLVRYNYNGSIDINFGVNGFAKMSIGNDIFFSVAIQDDRKIIALGSSDNNYVLVRYDENGNLDNTFNGTGIVTYSGGTFVNSLGSLLIQKNDQKIIVAGSYHNGSNFDFSIGRYNTNGTVDNTFGTGGFTITQIGSFHESIFSAALQDDGKIVATGSYNDGAGNIDFAVVRYDSTGSLDNTFGTNGIVITPVGVQNDIAFSIGVQSSGKILVGGFARSIGDISEFAVVRYNSNGSLDNTFGTNGIVITPADAGSGDLYVGAHSLVIQSSQSGEDNVILGGSTSNGQLSGYSFFTLARYTAGMVTGVKDDIYSNPKSYLLSQNYPNPFNPATKIQYSIPNVGTSFMKFVRLKVYDVLGNEIAILVNEEKAPGEYEVKFLADGLPSGLYFYRLETGNFTSTKKMIYLK